jgi:RND family efflux transporter MFP subunit
MNKNIFYTSLIAVLIIGGIVTSFLYKNLSERPSYSIFQVQRGNIEEALDLSGKIKPELDANLGFESGGRITNLTHQVGDFVAKGTLLAQTNATDLEAQYREAVDLKESAEADLEQYEQLVKKEKSTLDSLEDTGASSADKKAQKAQIKASEAQVDSQDGKLSAALANEESARAQIAKTIILAPFDGVISAEDVKMGEVAQSNVPILTLISRDAFKVEAYASEVEVKNLKADDPAQITLDGDPQKIYNAKISSIDPAESLQGNVSNYKVTLNFSAPVAGLRSGIGANISAVGQKKENTMIIPRNALFEESGKKFVYVPEQSIMVKKEIQTGIYSLDNRVEIISGLSPGDKIFTLNK